MSDKTRLVLQNWSRGQNMGTEALLNILRDIGGVSVLSLDRSSGLIEFDSRHPADTQRVRDRISRDLPDWKVYEESVYHTAQ